jgi:hypothetical protein
MKRVTYILSALLFLLLTGFTKSPLATGETNGRLGSFIIEKSQQPLICDARILPTYDVKYENSGFTLRVGIDSSDKKCKKYIVVSDDFAVQYFCQKDKFGVGLIESKYIEDGIPSTDSRLNREEFFRQKVLTMLPDNEIEHVKLISVFFPKLIKEEVLYANK